MKRQRYDEAAAQLLRDEPEGSWVQSELTRARNIGALEQALRQHVHRRRARRRVLAIAAAVLVCLGGSGVALRLLRTHDAVALASEGNPLVFEGEREQALQEGMDVSAGARIITPAESHTALQFATGSRVFIEEKSEVRLLESGRSHRLALAGGAVSAQVKKLVPGQRFRIHTDDAEVEVRGTAFRVSVLPAPLCPGGPRTRVEVSEGVVTVASGGSVARVMAGASWPPPCPPAPEATPQQAAPTPAHSGRPRPSQLAVQNDLFARAAAERRRGNHAAAVAQLDRLISTWPAGSLVEPALVERMKALGAIDPPAARRAAQSYLRRYPTGFAREEAEALLAEPR